MRRIRIAPAAREDLRDIRAYSKSAFGAQAALAYLEVLRGIFRLPLERRLARITERDLSPDMRSVRFRSHRIVYVQRADGIASICILHLARDFRSAFGDRQ